MTHDASVALLLFALSLAALPTQVGAAQTAAVVMPAAGETVASAPSAADKRFVSKAGADGLAEVEAGKLAVRKGSSEGVRQLGQMMIDDHSQANQQLSTLAGQKNLTLPTQPDAAEQKKLSKLEGLSGAAFDQAFIAQEWRGHEEAIALFSKEAKSGKDSDLRKFASDTLPKLKAHLEQVRALKQEQKKK